MKLFAAAAVLLAVAPSVTCSVIRAVADDIATCERNAKQWLHAPMNKERAVTAAMNHCVTEKYVKKADRTCSQYGDLLSGAFKREHSETEYTAAGFCKVAENYAVQMKGAAKIPKMGKGSGSEFKLSKSCQVAAKKEMGKDTKLPAHRAPKFWYSLCVNQDCAHYLPSRTRWCTANHAPTHGYSVCESLMSYVSGKVERPSAGSKDNEFDADQLCHMYDDFVEEKTEEYGAYMHVVHKKGVPIITDDTKPHAKSSARLALPGFALVALFAFRA